MALKSSNNKMCLPWSGLGWEGWAGLGLWLVLSTAGAAVVAQELSASSRGGPTSNGQFTLQFNSNYSCVK